MMFGRHRMERDAGSRDDLRLDLGRSYARLSAIRRIAMNPRLEFSPEIDREYREAADSYQRKLDRWMKLYPGEAAIFRVRLDCEEVDAQDEY
jgi:hypothetical protein